MDNLRGRLEPVRQALFGTDGVRGRANIDLTPELALAVGAASGRVVAGAGGRAVIGRDTRRSGPMLEAALVAGLTSVGVDVLLAGIVPTPGISFLIKDERAQLGVVVSASHNPPEDNGIKLFDEEGLKLTEAAENRIASDLAAPPATRTVEVGSARELPAAAARYAAFLTGAMETDDVDLSGSTIVVDCAYGATGAIATRVLEHFHARVIEMHAEPCGERINEACGVGDVAPLRAAVLAHDAQLGIAFDGDGDRVLLVTAAGDILDGDSILGIAAIHQLREGRLDPRIVVATVLSNYGLERGLKERGISLRRTPVGDRHVAREMRATNARLGGEKSGHIIFRDHSSTGDGILTAVKLLEVVHETGRSLEDLAREVPLLPQEQRDVPTEDPVALLARPEVLRIIDNARTDVGDRGRVLVRASGTQALLRVMVEAEEPERCLRLCDELVSRLVAVTQSL